MGSDSVPVLNLKKIIIKVSVWFEFLKFLTVPEPVLFGSVPGPVYLPTQFQLKTGIGLR